MHEYVIAVGIVESLSRFSSQSGKVVKSFKVVLGEISMLNQYILAESLKFLIEESVLKGAQFSVEIEDAKIECGLCGRIMSFSDTLSRLDEDDREVVHFIPELIGSFSPCSNCGSMNLKLVSGRGVTIKDVVAQG